MRHKSMGLHLYIHIILEPLDASCVLVAIIIDPRICWTESVSMERGLIYGISYCPTFGCKKIDK